MIDEDKNKPSTVMKRAIDVTPYRHAIWCTVGGSAPFANDVVSRKWSEDGRQIVFMLESCNFEFVAPEEEMEIVEIPLSSWISPDRLPELEEEDREFVTKYVSDAELGRMMAL